MEEKRYSTIKILLLWAVVIVATAWFISSRVGDNVATVASDQAIEPIYQGPVGKNQVALAINVDWGQEYLSGILAELTRNEITATFFLTGRWTANYPDAAKMIQSAGMEIGNHGYSHKSPNSMSYDENLQEIVDTDNVIQRTLAIKSCLFAPASGERDEQVLQAAAAAGYKTILWTVDTVDWQKPSVDTILQRVTSKLVDGAIVLMHPTENTLAALPELIKTIKAQGYEIVPVSKVIQ